MDAEVEIVEAAPETAIPLIKADPAIMRQWRNHDVWEEARNEQERLLRENTRKVRDAMLASFTHDGAAQTILGMPKGLGLEKGNFQFETGAIARCVQLEVVEADGTVEAATFVNKILKMPDSSAHRKLSK